MKKITLLIFAMCFITLGFSQADCGTAIALTPGAPQAGATTTGVGSFSDSNTAPEVNPCSTNYNDLEYWFEYTAVETGETLDITVSDLTSNYYGVFVIDNCPDSLPTCVASSTNGFSAADLTVTTTELTAGTTYYIVLSDWIEGPTSFTINSVVNPAPVCYAAVAAATLVEDCDNSQFSILVDVTDLGDSTNLEITNDAGIASTTVTATGEVTVGPFPISTPVTLILENENDDLCDVVLDSVLDSCPVDSNTLDYYNLQWPATLTFPLSEMTDQMVYAQFYEEGLTDTTVGEAAAGVEVWIGYSATDTDPSTEDWTWEVATFFGENGNNDEYNLAMQNLGLDEGTYYYATRYKFNGGPFTYGGILADGSTGDAWDGTTYVSGVLTITEPLTPANDDFANAITVACGDTVSGDTRFATLDEVDASDIATVETDTAADIDSPNVWYSFMGTGEVVTLSTCANTSYDSEIFVFTGTSGNLVTIDDGYDECGVNYEAETSFTSVSGTQYYIAVEGYNVGSTGTFELAVTCVPAPTCTNATATYSIVSDCAVSGGFNIEVDITDMGTATEVSVTDDQGNVAQTATELSTLTFGPYTNATDVLITISDINDATCVQTTDALTQVACPPDNTICNTAETVTLGINEAGPEVTGTNVGATDSGVADPSCNNFYNGSDIWYSFTTPADLELITLDIASSGFSSTIAVVYDNCTDLNEIDCDVQFLSSPTVIFDNLDAETSYILRLYDFGGDSFGPISFNMSATTSLSVDTIENEAAFTYFPNPVENTLTLNAQKTIEQVAMYNMLGQEVLRATPNTLASDLDMSNLQTGTYFVKVTIANVTETIRVIKQ